MSTKTQVIPLRRIIPLPNTKKVTFPSRIAIATKTSYQLIETNSILYLKADSNYTEIYLSDGSRILTATTLKKYEAILDPLQFMRVHKSYIVQHTQIEFFYPQDNKLVLRSAQEVPVSRSRKEGLVNHLRTLMV